MLFFLDIFLFPILLIITLNTFTISFISISPENKIEVPFFIFLIEQLVSIPDTVRISIPFSSFVLFIRVILLIGDNDSYSSITSIWGVLSILSMLSLILIN